MKCKDIAIDFTKGAPGLQAQLARQGVYATPESSDAMATAEGDRLAICRLMSHGYFPESVARALVFAMVTALLRYPLRFDSVGQEGGGK
jgi:hypothetical protein